MLADVGDQHLVDYESPIVSLPGELLQLIDPTNLDIRRLGAELVDCPAEPLTELPLPGYSDRSLLLPGNNKPNNNLVRGAQPCPLSRRAPNTASRCAGRGPERYDPGLSLTVTR
jgi:hypothetical protein